MPDKRPMAMTETEDALEYGGAAFPSQMRYGDGSAVCWPGMTLFDYFAGQALGAIIEGGLAQHTPEEAARLAYDYAKAMVKEGMARRNPSVTSSEEPETP
jgi:hypothetical protein